MPFDPSTGVFTRPSNSFSDPITGTVIDPTDADGLFDAYDAALSTPRFSLTGALTGWVRSDGNDANDGLTNSAGGAKATWNNLISTFAARYDLAGKTLTFKSGTTNTYTSGIAVNSPFVGGGTVVIDLNGSSIAETVTKGIINNVWPGIVIRNSAGLGTGGVISSSGFAGVQCSFGGIGIADGITFGTCLDAAIEVIQGSSVALSAPIRCNSSGGRSFILVATNGNFGFNGQSVNFVTADPTYTDGFIVADSNGTVLANSAVFNLGGRTVTGPKFKASNGGQIYTGLAGVNFFPGTANSYTVENGGDYDNLFGAAIIYGGSATNSTVSLRTTSNPAPSGDSATVIGSTISLFSTGVTSTINLGIAGFSGALLGFNGSTSGTTILKATAIAGSNTLTLPTVTDTLVTKTSTDTLSNKSVEIVTTNTVTSGGVNIATAWTTYTPTIGTGSGQISSSAGTITTISGAAGAYKQIGKTVFWRVLFTLTTIGTASGSLIINFPNSFQCNGTTFVPGQEAGTKKNLGGQAGTGGTGVTTNFYDGTSAIAGGNAVFMMGVFEAL